MKYLPTRLVQKEGGSLSSCLNRGSWFRYEGKSPGESPNRKSPIIVNAKNSCGTSSTCDTKVKGQRSHISNVLGCGCSVFVS